jgi:hypothetical protein
LAFPFYLFTFNIRCGLGQYAMGAHFSASHAASSALLNQTSVFVLGLFEKLPDCARR